jgi:ABC-type multidrug transport system fused ATPase/permease subunit
MDFISELPKGLIPKSVKTACCSGGQRQRLAIARALLKNAPLLISMKRLRRWIPNRNGISSAGQGHEGRTTLVIAHRLSTSRKPT